MKNLILFSFLPLFLLSCKTSYSGNSAQKNEENINQKWELAELRGKSISVDKKKPFILFNKAQVSGNAGCNSFSGAIEISSKGKLKFSKVASTMMACADMSLEHEFHKVLEETDNYSIQDGVLSLNNGKMTPLAKFKKIDESVSLKGEWELDYISGPRIAFGGLYPNEKPTIQFDFEKQTVFGSGSCNRYQSEFELNNANLKLGPIGATRMACEGMGESTYFKTLETVTGYNVSGNTLNLLAGDVPVLRFKRLK